MLDHLGNFPSNVEAEFLTRPKPSVGVRLELLPDIATSTYLQGVANRLTQQELALERSLSARLFNFQFSQENPYDVWSVSVPSWIRSELDNGRTVIIVDIRDYFGSVAAGQIEGVLRGRHLDQTLIDNVLVLISKINSLPDIENNTRSGIPVAPDDLFWLIGDILLGTTDLAIKNCGSVISHVRWVDDFFVSTFRGMERKTIENVSSIIGEHGFSINYDKTRIYTSVEQFDRETFTREHQIITELFHTAASAGALSEQQRAQLAALVEETAAGSIGDVRLWKRVYALARRLKDPLLLNRAH